MRVLKEKKINFQADIQLVERALEGERKAEVLLVERLLVRVQATVKYMVSDIEEHEDWIQDSILEVLRSLPQYKGQSPFESWAHTIVVRTTSRRLKGYLKRRSRWAIWDRIDGILSPSTSPSKRHENNELGAILVSKIYQLPAEKRMVIVLKLVHGFSLKEIAAMTQTPQNTVRERLRTARISLREMIRKDISAKSWLEDLT